MNFLRSIFSPSVDSITASLKRTVSKLEAHTVRQTTVAETMHKAADAIRNAAHAAEDEAVRAEQVAKRIAGLLF